MKSRKIEDELEARACLAAVDAAGVPAAAWARSHGIDGRSLNAWRVNLSRASPGARRTRKPLIVDTMVARGFLVLDVTEDGREYWRVAALDSD